MSDTKKEFKKDYSFLKAWSKKIDIPLEKLKADFDKLFELVLEETDADMKVAWSLTRTRMYTSVKRQMQSSGYIWWGFFITKDLARDWVAKHIKICMEKYAECKKKGDPDKAEETGHVKLEKDNSGRIIKVTPLYYYKIRPDGTENKKYGEPLPERGFVRSMTGVVARKSDIEDGKYNLIKKTSLLLWSPFADEISPDYFDPERLEFIEFRAESTNETDDTYYLGTPNKGTMEVKSSGFGINYTDILYLFEDDRLPLNELEEVFLKNLDVDSEEKRQSYKLFVSKIGVVDIRFGRGEGEKKTSDQIYVDSEELGLSLEDGKPVKSIMGYMPRDSPINFGKDSELLIFYKMTQKRLYDPVTKEVMKDKWGDIYLSINGYIPISIVETEVKLSSFKSVEKEEVESTTLEEGETKKVEVKEVSKDIEGAEEVSFGEETEDFDWE